MRTIARAVLVGVFSLACDSDQPCLQRVCDHVTSVVIRHSSEVIPLGEFRALIEFGDQSYLCANSVPEDLDRPIACASVVPNTS